MEQLSGNPEAEELFCRALRHETGEGVPRDLEQAAALYEEAARKGHPQAQFALGIFYLKGMGVGEADEDEAFMWWKKAAKNGHRQAQFNLGVAYRNGGMVPVDPEESRRWISKAAEGGHALAQFHLGRECYHGKGGQRDFSQAFHWLEKAAKQGFAAAQCDLAQLYATGQGTGKQDTQTAYAWAWCARINGYQEAEKVLKAMERTLGLTGNQLRQARLQGEKFVRLFPV